MNFTTLIVLVLIVLIIILSFKVLKSLVKTTLLMAILFIFIATLAGVLALSDLRDLRANYPALPNLFLIKKEGEVLFAAQKQGESIKILENKDAWNQDIKQYLDTYYRIIIIKKNLGPGDYQDEVEKYDLAYLIDQYQKNNTLVYPESAYFKVQKIPFLRRLFT